jgi:diadenosine tetraphosphate (Ap4A) HIT family hydrolase
MESADVTTVNDTIRKFGYPATVVAEYERWVVLLRPQQATFGALVLAHRGPETSFSAIDAPAFAELGRITADIETTLARLAKFERINYLMLMMVDPHVHFHVIPRYSAPREFAGVSFTDNGWPRLPDLTQAPTLSEAQQREIVDHLRTAWPAGVRRSR